MNTTAIAPWYGSNRMLAKHVGAALAGCSWVGIPFAGGMCEVKSIKARTIQVNDVHPHITNLARVMADPVLGPQLYRRLRRKLFHPVELADAQSFCLDEENYQRKCAAGLFGDEGKRSARTDVPCLEWAEAYFVVAWMTRHGSAGDAREFKAPLSTRWESGGGDSNAHYRSGIEALSDWRKIFKVCNFSALDFREFLEKCKDIEETGIYCDPPFPGPGEKYKFAFTNRDHKDLRDQLMGFRNARIVVRYYDHPLINDLYSDSSWERRELVGRKQTNEAAPELLLIRNGVAA